MDIFMYICAAVIGYLIGSVNIAIMITGLFMKKDVRTMGSKNAGATNVARVFGMKLGLVTLLGDFVKTAIAMVIGFLLQGENGMLVGLASLARTPFGSRNQYVRLTGMHVSRDHRGMGIGTGLFHLVKDVAEGWGAEKIYISTQSSKETQAFYAAMGCVDAQETNLQAAQSGPLDRQLECAL